MEYVLPLGSGPVCDFESTIPALASVPPVPPNQLARDHAQGHFRPFGTSLGHLPFLSP